VDAFRRAKMSFVVRELVWDRTGERLAVAFSPPSQSSTAPSIRSVVKHGERAILLYAVRQYPALEFDVRCVYSITTSLRVRTRGSNVALRMCCWGADDQGHHIWPTRLRCPSDPSLQPCVLERRLVVGRVQCPDRYVPRPRFALASGELVALTSPVPCCAMRLSPSMCIVSMVLLVPPCALCPLRRARQG